MTIHVDLCKYLGYITSILFMLKIVYLFSSVLLICA